MAAHSFGVLVCSLVFLTSLDCESTPRSASNVCKGSYFKNPRGLSTNMMCLRCIDREFSSAARGRTECSWLGD